MRYDFDAHIERKGTRCEKYDNLLEVFGRDDIMPAWVADMDFATPDFILRDIKERLNHPILAYSFRDNNYYNSIINFLDRRVGWKVERDWLDFTPGVVCGVGYAINFLTKEGDGVIIQPPIYPPFARTIKSNNRKVVENPLLWDGEKYQIDFEDLDKKMAQAEVFILCNPHNPSGRVFSREELTKVGELAIKHGVRIISDEIHSDILLFGSKHTHIASISKEISDITITFIAPSKTFNLAGLSSSVVIIPNKDLMQLYRNNGDKLHVGQGNIFGAIALESAYNNGDEWLDQLKSYLENSAKYVVDFVGKNMPKIKCYLPEATFLIWMDFRELGLTHSELQEFLLDKANIGLTNGLDYGKEGECFMRLNIGTPLSNIETIMKQLHAAYCKNF